jgi:hypothetical protein
MLNNQHKLKIIGRRELVSFPLLHINNIEAKIDTGAYTSSIHCKEIKIVEEKGKPILHFTLLNDLEYTCDTFTKKKIKNSFGEIEERYIIKTLISIGKKRILTTVSLSDRGSMRYPVLIGRRLLKGKFIVDVNLKYTKGILLNKK